MTLPRISLLIMLVALLGLTPAAAQQIRTPPPGTSERTQILDALRPSPGSKIRFIVHQLKVIKGKTATYAYAVVEPSRQEYDGGEFLLKQDGRWRVIWSVTGGGTDDCRTAATYYQSALRLFQAKGSIPMRSTLSFTRNICASPLLRRKTRTALHWVIWVRTSPLAMRKRMIGTVRNPVTRRAHALPCTRGFVLPSHRRTLMAMASPTRSRSSTSSPAARDAKWTRQSASPTRGTATPRRRD